MKRLVIALTALSLVSAVAVAKDERPNYFDKDTYACENEQLGERMKVLYSDYNDPFRVIYVTGARELSRNTDGLRCAITLVHSRGRMDGVITYRYTEGHAVYGFKPGKAKS